MLFINYEQLLPDYASDLTANLKNLFQNTQEGLNDTQVAGVALATALTLGNEKLVNIIKLNPRFSITEEELRGLKAATAIMLQNNTYYKIFSDVKDEGVRALPSGLEMTILQNPPIDQVNFEIYALAVSVANGCAYCCNVHIKKLKTKGLEDVAIRNVIKIVSIIKATAQTLEIESIRFYDFIVRDQSI